MKLIYHVHGRQRCGGACLGQAGLFGDRIEHNDQADDDRQRRHDEVDHSDDKKQPLKMICPQALTFPCVHSATLNMLALIVCALLCGATRAEADAEAVWRALASGTSEIIALVCLFFVFTLILCRRAARCQ